MFARNPYPCSGEALVRLLTRQKSGKSEAPIFCLAGVEAITCFPTVHLFGQMLTFSMANC